MAIIKVLPEHLINQIAAGEVVERPASVVKELVENSLDAGAKRITIEVNGGGDDLLRITDDGIGMEPEDARMALERHATSKITSSDDLFNIRSLGFRGEALASISSVSNFVLQTKKRGSMYGTMIVCEGGQLKKVKAMGCPEGTQAEVRQLFFNTPARKKYLKNDSTEYGHILDTLTGLALANNEVAFRLVHDDKVVFDLPATEDSIVRAAELLGRQVTDCFIPVFYGHSQIQLEGFIGKPVIARSNRRGQHLFVNGREVNSHVLSYAVRQSYFSLLPKEKYPVFLLFLTIDPSLVDVNVHPRKLEVRFSDEKEVFRILVSACKKALEKHVLAPVFSADSAANDGAAYGVADFGGADFGVAREHSGVMKVEDKPLLEETARVVVGVAERAGLAELEPLAQLDNSYILCRQGDALVIIDQHAAHERIRYSELLAEFERKQKSVQPLLAPLQLELPPREAALIEDNKELFEGMGYEIEPFGGNTYSVFAVPGYLVKHDIAAALRGLLDDLCDYAEKGDFQKRKERALVFAACRSAVKFGDPLSKEEQQSLCEKLMKLDLPYTCPHGRPTMFSISFDELEKRFGRDYRD
ncbi:DNA mismatch repair endonuclease MutL [Patescibacteria group bacterium]|nr:DNA mismatch repair endonuclease MutL [Patescibacteria group bacterium]MBU1703714.1 DNA mismatch repair endonuclease MutL [Patescibacteria group bacterium]MBU1953537.1 DNA mismatch repair endonuclease MutL [Patescibacteria group bacterium]